MNSDAFTNLPGPADWSVLNYDVQAKCRLAANSVAAATGAQSLMDSDDLFQEALIWCATKGAEDVRRYVAADEMSHLYTRVRSRLIDKVKTEVERSSQSISYEVTSEAWAA